MRKEKVMEGNMDLLNEFMGYAFDHPDILDQIPKDAALVILPENDPNLYKENLRTVKTLEKEGRKFVIIRMKRPEKIPIPRVEVIV